MINDKYSLMIEDTFNKRKEVKIREQQPKKHICFSCLTPFHVFTSFLLARYVYSSCNNILFISNFIENAYDIIKKIDEFDIFTYTKVIDERNRDEDYIYSQISVLKDFEIDVLHFYSWGSKANLLLLSCLQPSTKVILTDEGIMTYSPLEFAREYITRHNCFFLEEFLTTQVDEIWLYNPVLYNSALAKNILKIPTKMFLRSLELEVLNYIFSVDMGLIGKDFKVLFLDQNLSVAGLVPLEVEKFLFKTIMNFLDEKKVLLKKHPSDGNFLEKYNEIRDLNVEILFNNFPVELLLVNLNKVKSLTEKVFVTYFSSSVFNVPVFTQDSKYKIFLLSNIFSKIVNSSDNRSLNYVNNMTLKFSSIYGGIYNPKDLIEFKRYIDSF